MAVAHRDVALALLPPGHAFPREQDAVWYRLLEALGRELDRAGLAAETLLKEVNPGAAQELLTAWEMLVGLPEDCVTEPQSESIRQQAIIAKLTLVGRQDPAVYVELAETIGVTAVVEEFHPAHCGSPCVVPLTQDEPRWAHCQSGCTSALRLNGWRFFWRLRQLEPSIETLIADCKVTCLSALQRWGNDLLECKVAPMVPAHTIVTFCYGEE